MAPVRYVEYSTDPVAEYARSRLPFEREERESWRL
jgi:hypothetical protein